MTLVLRVVFMIAGGLPLPGGAVMVERHRLRGRFSDTLVSPLARRSTLSPVLLGVVSAVCPEAIYGLDEPRAAFWAALTFLAYLQIAIALLNLCPIPGLDGYGMAEPYCQRASAGSAPGSGPSEC